MKILFISNDPTIFDTASSTHARMKDYAEVFGELHIVSCAGPGISVRHEGPLTLHPVHGPKPLALLSMIGFARKIIRDHDIQVVSAQDPFEYGFIGVMAVRGTQAKLHLQIHTDFLSPWFARGSFVNTVRRHIAGATLPKAEGIRVVSKRIKEALVKKYGSRIKTPAVIPLTVSATLPAPTALPPHAFTFACMTIGRLEKEKRMGDVLRAVAVAGPQVGLFVVGDGSQRMVLEILAKFLGIEKRVVFLGWRTDALALLQNAHAYVQASAYEGYGRTLIEAGLARTPIITTDVGVVGDILLPGKTALVAPVGNYKALSGLIRALSGDRALEAHLKDEAFQAVEAHLKNAGNLAETVRADLARLI
jgi:glycosyltransferase involved in cell wall biosynthesis